jgi:hypothetical protein
MNAYDIYEFYIEAKDLKGQAHKVKIESAYVKEVFNPGTKGKDKKILLRLAGKQKVLSLNKTRAEAMIDITGTPDFEKWAGVEIVIKPGKQSGKDTVIIEAAPAAGPAPRNQPAKIEHATRLAELQAKSETDVITAYSELWKAAGLDNETAQAILKEYTGDFKAAFDKIAKDYAYIIG